MLGAVMFAGCAKQEETSQTVAASPAATSAALSSPADTAVAAATPAGDPPAQVAFTDISGIYAQQSINDEAKLGVLDATSGTFQPNGPISRATFVRWLVKANNAYTTDSAAQIRLAESGDATFVDVPATHPDFKYIQGLANAGYVVGIDATHFAPDRMLTREEMVGIKAPLDVHGPIAASVTDGGYLNRFADVAKINKRYQVAIANDEDASYQHDPGTLQTSGNLGRAYGTLKNLQPQKTVTRGEAALAVSQIGGGPMSGYQFKITSAAATLGRTPPPCNGCAH